MVGSYLICDVCGQFGPPASFLSKDGLRLCYQCWFQERLDELPPEDGTEAAPRPAADPPDADDRPDGEQVGRPAE